MAKVIRTVVDAEGNVGLDFVGFIGGECVAEDSRLGQGLAELGLCVRPLAKQRKQQADEAGTSAAGGRRVHQCG